MRRFFSSLLLCTLAFLVALPQPALGQTNSHTVRLQAIQVQNGQATALVAVDNTTYLVAGTIRGHRVTIDQIVFCLAPPRTTTMMVQPLCGGGGGGGGGSGTSVTRYWLGGSYLEWPIYLSSPPYAWYTGIWSTPTFHIYLDPATAINTGAALAAITFFLGVLTIFTGGAAVVALFVAGVIALDYGIMYSTDHNWDSSFDSWWPYDWFNVLETSIVHLVYAATPRYWWIVSALGAYVVAGR